MAAVTSRPDATNNQALADGNKPLRFRIKRPPTIVYAPAPVGLVALIRMMSMGSVWPPTPATLTASGWCDANDSAFGPVGAP
jgi:hypothetical protein